MLKNPEQKAYLICPTYRILPEPLTHRVLPEWAEETGGEGMSVQLFSSESWPSVAIIMTHCVLRRVILSVRCYLNEERFVRKGNEAKEINLFRIIRSQNLTVPAHAAF